MAPKRHRYTEFIILTGERANKANEFVLCRFCSERQSIEWAKEHSQIVNTKKLVKNHLRKCIYFQEYMQQQKLNAARSTLHDTTTEENMDLDHQVNNNNTTNVNDAHAYFQFTEDEKEDNPVKEEGQGGGEEHLNYTGNGERKPMKKRKTKQTHNHPITHHLHTLASPQLTHLSALRNVNMSQQYSPFNPNPMNPMNPMLGTSIPAVGVAPTLTPSHGCTTTSRYTLLPSYMNGFTYYKTTVEIIGHRGEKEYPNTIDGFQRAVEMGATILEMDLQLNKEKEIIVLHDSYNHETSELYCNLTETELRQYYPMLNTFHQVYGWLENISPSISIYLDLKGYGEELIFKLWNYLEQLKKPIKRQIMIASFNHMDLCLIDRLRSHSTKYELQTIQTVALMNGVPYNLAADFATRLHVNAISICYEDCIYSNIVQNAQSYGLNVYVWTVNTKECMKRMIELKVNGICTDYPNILYELIKESTESSTLNVSTSNNTKDELKL